MSSNSNTNNKTPVVDLAIKSDGFLKLGSTVITEENLSVLGGITQLSELIGAKGDQGADGPAGPAGAAGTAGGPPSIRSHSHSDYTRSEGGGAR